MREPRAIGGPCKADSWRMASRTERRVTHQRIGERGLLHMAGHAFFRGRVLQRSQRTRGFPRLRVQTEFFEFFPLFDLHTNHAHEEG